MKTVESIRKAEVEADRKVRIRCERATVGEAKVKVRRSHEEDLLAAEEVEPRDREAAVEAAPVKKKRMRMRKPKISARWTKTRHLITTRPETAGAEEEEGRGKTKEEHKGKAKGDAARDPSTRPRQPTAPTALKVMQSSMAATKGLLTRR
jgi:hypothetical protein